MCVCVMRAHVCVCACVHVKLYECKFLSHPCMSCITWHVHISILGVPGECMWAVF